jgi:D-sedoheptulose 7-phosphate isomerase
MSLEKVFESERLSIRENLRRQGEALEALREPVLRAAELLRGCLASGGKILIFGNGGSAADAQHWAAELTGRYLKERPAMAAVALTTDTSALTAIANDYGYERVFERQIEALARPGDVAVGISTSGSSPNVLAALKRARALGCSTVALLGRDGGAIAPLADVALVYPAHDTPRIQEFHSVLVHVLCALVESDP